MTLRGLGVLAGLIACLLFTACASRLRAVVFDQNGLEKEVYRVTTDRGKNIQVLDGLAFRRIALDKISTIIISPNETQSRDGEPYYMAEIWLADGTKIMSYVMASGARSASFLNINSTLLACTEGGTYAIKFKDIKQIRFLDPMPFWPWQKNEK